MGLSIIDIIIGKAMDVAVPVRLLICELQFVPALTDVGVQVPLTRDSLLQANVE